MQINAQFDANQYEPMQGFGKHPPGNKFPFEITGTEVKPVKDDPNSGIFVVTFSSPAGMIMNNYNIFNKSEKAKEIAHGQLSALCRAVGRHQLDFNNEGAALRGARGLMDVGYQNGQEPTAEKPEGGYVEIKKVYDINGIEPGKTNAGAGQQQQQPQPQNQGFQNAQPQPGNQPMTQQPGGTWGNQAPQGQTNPAPSQGFQGGNQNAAPQQGGAWQPGNAGAGGGQTPPWGSR